LNIKLFVCCHQACEVPQNHLLVPIQVGATLSDERFPDFLSDDAGEDNISSKNRSYCELTAQYWAWKHAEADYYGFFHYRRYLYPNPGAKRPYRLEQAPSPEVLERLGYGQFEELIGQYDMIVPKGEDMHIPVWKHYAQAPFHHEEDLALTWKIILERYPEFIVAAESYLNGTICYFGNIFVMNREIFRNYCAWLFPLLSEFDKQTDISGYSPQERRVDGYLAERLLGIFVTQMRTEGGVKMLELPRVHFISQKDYFWQRLLNAALPPGSLRRSVIKGLRRGRG